MTIFCGNDGQMKSVSYDGEPMHELTWGCFKEGGLFTAIVAWKRPNGEHAGLMRPGFKTLSAAEAALEAFLAKSLYLTREDALKLRKSFEEHPHLH